MKNPLRLLGVAAATTLLVAACGGNAEVGGTGGVAGAGAASGSGGGTAGTGATVGAIDSGTSQPPQSSDYEDRSDAWNRLVDCWLPAPCGELDSYVQVTFGQDSPDNAEVYQCVMAVLTKPGAAHLTVFDHDENGQNTWKYELFVFNDGRLFVWNGPWGGDAAPGPQLACRLRDPEHFQACAESGDCAHFDDWVQDCSAPPLDSFVCL